MKVKREVMINAMGQAFYLRDTQMLTRANGLAAICLLKGLPPSLHVKLATLKRALEPHVQDYMNGLKKANDEVTIQKKDAEGNLIEEFYIPRASVLKMETDAKTSLEEEIEIAYEKFDWPIVIDMSDSEKDVTKKRKIVPMPDDMAATMDFIDYSKVQD